jgi:hypothetical protein
MPFLDWSYFFFKAIFFFMLVIIFKDYKKEFFEKTLNALHVIAKINLLFMIIGMVFDINIFKSYPNSERFGFNGLIPEPGISSYFYILLAIVFYIKFIYEKSTSVDLILMLSAILLLGTKSGILFIFILLLVHVLNLFKNSISRIIFLVPLITLFFFLKDKIISIAINSYSFGPSIYNKYGLITFITSKRDLLLKEAIIYIQDHWNILNYIVGGVNLRLYRVEFEFVDIFLFSGITGLTIYFLFIKNIFFNKKQYWVYNILLLSVLLISSLGGNLFLSVTNSFFFSIVFLYLKDITIKK